MTKNPLTSTDYNGVTRVLVLSGGLRAPAGTDVTHRMHNASPRLRYVLEDGTAPKHPGSSGRIYLGVYDGEHRLRTQENFPGVIRAAWEDAAEYDPGQPDTPARPDLVEAAEEADALRDDRRMRAPYA